MPRTKATQIEQTVIETNRLLRAVLEIVSAGFWIMIGLAIAYLLPGVSLDPAWKVAVVIWFLIAVSKAGKYGLLALAASRGGRGRR